MEDHEANQQVATKRRPSMWWMIAVVLFVGVAIAFVVVMRQNAAQKAVTNFQTCEAAGGIIAESYPEQCMIYGRTYVNEEQVVSSSGDYIGLSERQAFTKAEDEGRTVRVVAREGESLPVTMDFVDGRLNLTIQNGVVHRVGVEGVE